MKDLRSKLCFFLASILALALFTTVLEAYTAQQIVDSVIDELNDVTDYTASVDVDIDNPLIDDMTDGSLQWKRSSGAWKCKMVEGSPYSGSYITDGNVGWNIVDSNGDLYFAPKESYDRVIRARFGTDMFNMESILDAESWTKADSNETVNSVECYKVYTTKDANDYEVWIDTATRTKVVRVKATNAGDYLQWQHDYSDYSNVENTVQLPATIVTKRYDDDVEEFTCTYSFSSININEGLADSIFDINHPDL